MPGIGVVLNPKSRQNLRDPGASERLGQKLGRHGVVRVARTIEELYAVASDFRRDAVDVLAISGGDGTNTVTLSAFFDVYGDAPLPLLALLRGGTMNTVANAVGVRRGRPEDLLARLVQSYDRRALSPLESVERYVMRIVGTGDGAPGGRPQFGFLFGAGVVHGFLAEYYGSGEPSPRIAARILVRASASALVRGETIRRMAAPFHGTVSLNEGDCWAERDYLAVAAGTVAHIGLGFMPFHRFSEPAAGGGGAFHALGIHASAAEFVAELPRIHRGVPMRAGRACEAVSTGMLVRSTRGPVRYMIDGDLHSHDGAIDVTVGPRVRLLRVR